MRLLATFSTLTMLLAVPAFAQSGNPAFMAFGKGPTEPNNVDRVFVDAAVRGGMAEVELGRLAAENAESDAVKDFGRRMVEDHGAANDRLIALAKEDGIPVPEELDDEHKAMRDTLQAVSGEALDLAYIQRQVADHQKTVQLLEHEIGAGQDVELKSFATDMLPVVLDHLEAAKEIHAELTAKTS